MQCKTKIKRKTKPTKFYKINKFDFQKLQLILLEARYAFKHQKKEANFEVACELYKKLYEIHPLYAKD